MTRGFEVKSSKAQVLYAFVTNSFWGRHAEIENFMDELRLIESFNK